MRGNPDYRDVRGPIATVAIGVPSHCAGDADVLIAVMVILGS